MKLYIPDTGLAPVSEDYTNIHAIFVPKLKEPWNASTLRIPANIGHNAPFSIPPMGERPENANEDHPDRYFLTRQIMPGGKYARQDLPHDTHVDAPYSLTRISMG